MFQGVATMWTFTAIELSVFALFAYAVYHSSRIGIDKLLTLLGAAVFGLLIEFYFVSVAQGYSYGDFFIDPTLNGHSVPLWVGVGWGTIIYASMVASDRMGLPWGVRPAADALLAVSVDMAIDPVAEQMGWWNWSRPGQFFDIPCDNFIGWLMIVGSYSMWMRFTLSILGSSKTWVFLAPILSIFGCTILVAVAQAVLEKVYPLIGEPLVFLIGISVLFSIVYARWGKDLASSKAADRFSSTLVIYMHALMLFITLVSGTYEHVPALLVVLPLAAVSSVFGFHYRALSPGA